MTASSKPPIGSVASADTIVGSASVDGKLIGVVATAAQGTLLHQGSASGASWERITIMACNNDTVARLLTIEWAPTDPAAPTAAEKIIRNLYPQQGMRLIVDRTPVRRTSAIYAYAAAANVVNCFVETQRL